MFNNSQCNIVHFASRLTVAHPGSSHCRTCRHCMSPTAEVLVSPARLVAATSPLPSCNGPPGELCRMASLAASRLSRTAADRGKPATHLTMSDLAPSLVVAEPGRYTISTQHRDVAATRPTGPSPYPCDKPSTLGYDAGAPTYSSRRGSWSWTPYAGVKSGPLFSSS